MKTPPADWPIVLTDDGYYRRVNHDEKLASAGFTTAAKMAEWTEHLRTDAQAEQRMRERYYAMFETSA